MSKEHSMDAASGSPRSSRSPRLSGPSVSPRSPLSSPTSDSDFDSTLAYEGTQTYGGKRDKLSQEEQERRKRKRRSKRVSIISHEYSGISETSSWTRVLDPSCLQFEVVSIATQTEEDSYLDSRRESVADPNFDTIKLQFIVEDDIEEEDEVSPEDLVDKDKEKTTRRKSSQSPSLDYQRTRRTSSSPRRKSSNKEKTSNSRGRRRSSKKKGKRSNSIKEEEQGKEVIKEEEENEEEEEEEDVTGEKVEEEHKEDETNQEEEEEQKEKKTEVEVDNNNNNNNTKKEKKSKEKLNQQPPSEPRNKLTALHSAFEQLLTKDVSDSKKPEDDNKNDDQSSDDSEPGKSHYQLGDTHGGSRPELVKYHRETTPVSVEAPTTPVSMTRLNEVETLKARSFASDVAFGGICQFCGKDMRSSPTAEEVLNMKQKQNFCCPGYENFVMLKELVLQADDEFRDEVSTKIDISTKRRDGNEGKKTTRDRALERLRERELERQRNTAQQANMFQSGWTAKPVTPPPKSPPLDEQIFQVEVNSAILQKSASLNVKLYDNGKPFLTIFPDGTGCCYYPNGQVAVMITSTAPDRYTYIAHSSLPEDQFDDPSEAIIAIFDPTGNGIIHSQRRKKLKLFMNGHGGIELDRKGAKKRRWQWYFVKGHTTTPPFQPLYFPLNKYLSVRLLDQNNIALIFSAKKKCVRFNVGAKLKVSNECRIIPKSRPVDPWAVAVKFDGHGSFEVDKSETFLNKKRKDINEILLNLHDALRLPKTVRLDKQQPYPTTIQRKGGKNSPILPPIDAESNDVLVN